ncbi:hypothetical protein SLS60_004620 [Paraconiothyrium brasiliense]|uniref:FAD-binding PCMH-type domain-containing protein n=1 Tax=Paraconiothyrium brasiliense TaxID=300254 RepID=A0ABR3RL12_9PLEO
MVSIHPFVLLMVHSLCLTVTTVAHAQFEQRTTVQVANDLAKALSPNATLIVPNDARWSSVVARVNYPRISPGYRLVVEVATEDDVAATVLYANRHNIDFLAIAGAHGESTTLNRLRSGIQINLRKLNFVNLQDDQTVAVGGGTLQWELTSHLYSHSRRAVTGLCECVSVAGPLLGAGHSALQSQYGFSADNLLSANVVLANGTTVLSSSTTNSDLFWAIRGAGHNFGIVTSFNLLTHPIPSTYSLYTLIYTRDKLDALFSLVNDIDSPPETRDPKFFLNAFLSRSAPDADPVFTYCLAYEGTPEDLHIRAKSFLALGPLNTTLTTDITYDKLYQALGFGKDSYSCSKNINQGISGVALQKWNIEGLKKAYKIFLDLTADPRFFDSFLLMENYGIVAVTGVDPSSTALPLEERERPILTSAVVHYEGNEEATRRDAAAYIKKIKEALYERVDKDEWHAYVNYAAGDEEVEEVYGRERWRVEKLRELKWRWDPCNRLRFFAPLV